MLYPVSNSKRFVLNLNGLWKFAVVPDEYSAATPLKNAAIMPVPSSFNDITTDKALRDYVGKVAYETCFSLPLEEKNEYRLRIGAASHKCEVYLNGAFIGGGLSGFLPVDIPLEKLDEENRLTVVIDNRLTYNTLPPGRIEPDGRQTINFDFYNYTGIHRDVSVYSRPKDGIDDITIKTVVYGDYRMVKAMVKGGKGKFLYTVSDRDGKIVATSENGDIIVENPQLWSSENPYRYLLTVKCDNDEYKLKFGIRKVTYDNDGLYINDKKVYLKGCCKHEDFYIAGKGNVSAVNVRDFELMKWLGANSTRTSHYPYSEEFMELADEYGIMVIDEVPAVGMNAFRGEGNFTPNRLNEETQTLHKRLMAELIGRDKNHPCVVMLSVANEPATEEDASRGYFKGVIDYTRTLTELPLTLPEVTKFSQESKVADLVDFTALNRYYGWYEEHGNLYKTREMFVDELTKWHDKYGKPIIVSEFGADTIEGYHSLPSEAFSEEYQCEMLSECFAAFDELPFVTGEHIWNFADFKTKQGTIRVRGNRKGIFTRDRQPKTAAFIVKKRWGEPNGK